MFKTSISNKIMTLLLALMPLAMVHAEETTTPQTVYASSSVLATGTWAKIRVSSTGIQRLTADVVRKAGFSDISKVRIYGYGGNLVPERLSSEWLTAHDDLMEVPTYTVGDTKYFYGEGPVSYDSNTSDKRIRNPYSDYGYYFITQQEGGATTTESELLAQVEASAYSHHSLYEKDEASWSNTGRELFEKYEIKGGASKTVNITIPAGNTSAGVYLEVASATASNYKVTCGQYNSTGKLSLGENSKAAYFSRSITVSDLSAYTTADESGNLILPVVIANTSSETTKTLRINYIAANFNTPFTAAALASGNYPAAEYVENISNQNHHADTPVDYVIIIPTSKTLYSAAETLALLHQQKDSLTYRIVPANELYNEFSSGTPDVSAYKRYLKMFYDKDVDNRVKYVLLFGDCLWDNRGITLASTINLDEYLLGYQTYDSYNLTSSALCDDFVAVLQDNLTIHGDGYVGMTNGTSQDVAIGRIPVVTPTDAYNVVNKIASYITASPSGDWQNDILFIGDNGDNNSHMDNINDNADYIISHFPGYNIKKMMLDAYEVQSSSTGDRFPEATTAVKKQQNDGALIINYGGHSGWTLLSKSKLLELSDFTKFKGQNYSLWFTAGCETMPLDQTYNTIGEAALLNKEGGAVAFIGTSRTVFENLNSILDKAFMKRVLTFDEKGNAIAVGEALRLAKNDITGKGSGKDNTLNKHQYILAGDPAMPLALPKAGVVVDNINGVSAVDVQTVKGNSVVNVTGHVVNTKNDTLTTFNGTCTVIVRDSEEEIKCRGNQGEEEDERFSYVDRTNTLYKGICTVSGGKFSFTFRVPRDIRNEGDGLITLYAIDPTQKIAVNGENTSIKASGWEDVVNDEIGPEIMAYLNTPDFVDGGAVGLTPYFVAEISDNDGINCIGTSPGHSMELCIDKDVNMTYNLDDNFQFDYGSYTQGQTYYVLPQLTPGMHSLTFRAWDLLNNSSTVGLNFNVVKTMTPELTDIRVSPNPVPANSSCTFYVTHDMRGSKATVYIDIISPMSQETQTIEWDDTFSDSSNTTTYKWVPQGLSAGLYLYRVRLTCDGLHYVSKARKLIIAQ